MHRAGYQEQASPITLLEDCRAHVSPLMYGNVWLQTRESQAGRHSVRSSRPQGLIGGPQVGGISARALPSRAAVLTVIVFTVLLAVLIGVSAGPAAASESSDCVVCHTNVQWDDAQGVISHPDIRCQMCHLAPGYDYLNESWPYPGSFFFTADGGYHAQWTCTSCHVAWPQVPAHTTASTSAAHAGAEDVECASCHPSALSARHASCASCHPGGTGAAPAGATCVTCHEGYTAAHAGGDATAAHAGVGASSSCDNCHGEDLLVMHPDLTCAECHAIQPHDGATCFTCHQTYHTQVVSTPASSPWSIALLASLAMGMAFAVRKVRASL